MDLDHGQRGRQSNLTFLPGGQACRVANPCLSGISQPRVNGRAVTRRGRYWFKLEDATPMDRLGPCLVKIGKADGAAQVPEDFLKEFRTAAT